MGDTATPDSTDKVSYAVDGLQAAVEILLDRWGVPHVYASSSNDAFFAQGWNAARDRLWQIDLWRRTGLGLLAEVFGPSYVERDRAARLFLYRGEMRDEWLSYGPDTERAVTAFVSGINEYVRFARTDPSRLPEEFRLMDYKPSLWSPEDVVRIRTNGLYQNVASEVERALVIREFGPEVEALRKPLDPPRDVTLPEGLDLSLIPADVLRVYELATEPVGFAEGQSPPARGLEGSNNWAISPGRTTTGRPILANDPHRAQSVPSLRYVVHLSAPGMDVIGAGEPALPGISIGHNGKIAFGLTIFSVDLEDLYVYRTDPEDASAYRYQGQWEPMEMEVQEIPVRGGEPAGAELRFTRHGPIVYEDPEQNVAFALRAAWLEPGMAPYLGSVECLRARNWDEFLAAMNRWGTPGENLAFADVEGNIGWKPACVVPRRPDWDGLLPVPGNGRYEWNGFLDASELPAEYNPPRGWIASANEMNLPDDYPHEVKKIGFEWYAPYRYRRIAEVLGASPGTGLQDSVKLQTDYFSLPARRIVTRLRGLRSEDPKTQRAMEMLRSWDCILRADSAPAALFEVWYRMHLREALFTTAIAGIVEPGRLAEAVSRTMQVEDQAGDARADLEVLEEIEARFGRETMAEVILLSLGEAVEHVERLLGAEWEWGRLHHAYLAHPLSPLVEGRTRERLNVGPVPRGGSGDTVGNTAYRLEDFRQTGGSSWRVVIDVGGWDNSLFVNSPGQSGDPASPHYSDHFRPWSRDEAVPLLYSRRKVEAATRSRIVLEPMSQ